MSKLWWAIGIVIAIIVVVGAFFFFDGSNMIGISSGEDVVSSADIGAVDNAIDASNPSEYSDSALDDLALP